MATIKSYSDLQQSKKLAEILPLETADMYYDRGGLPSLLDKYVTHESIKNDKYQHLIPCWSLAALLSVLPFPVLYMEMLGGMILWCCEGHLMETDEVVKIEHYNNPVDACYELITKLYEEKLL